MPAGKGKLRVQSSPAPQPAFRREAEEKRVFERGIGVERHEQHVVAVVEDLLRTVAVVIVDVDDRDARAAVDPCLSGDRGVVQVAVARERIRRGVMTGRTRARVRAAHPCVGDGLPCRERDVDRRTGRRPRSRQDRVAVVREPAELADHVQRLDVRLATNRAGVRHRLGILAESRRVPPACVGGFEELDVILGVHAEQRVRSETIRCNDRCQSRLGERVEDSVDPLGHLGRVDQSPAIQERLARVMRAVFVRGDDEHRPVLPTSHPTGTQRHA